MLDGAGQAQIESAVVHQNNEFRLPLHRQANQPVKQTPEQGSLWIKPPRPMTACAVKSNSSSTPAAAILGPPAPKKQGASGVVSGWASLVI